MGPGVLHAQAAAARFRLARHDPPAGLAAFVDFFWVVRWDLRGEPPHDQAILPHPNVNLAFEAAGAAVYGVDRKVFTRRLAGAGKALGVRFRPGGFRPFYSAPVSALNDRVVPASAIFGPEADRAGEAVMAAEADEAMIAVAADLLRAAAPRPDPVAAQVAGVVARITADSGLRRVAQVADAYGIPERRLQRLFAEYVGVSPKWVMRRARLHEAALRADAGPAVDWAALAADLGYADQAHLTRDFTATLGVPPSRYAGRRQGPVA
jgi:AraC-like DNA-binding protein